MGKAREVDGIRHQSIRLPDMITVVFEPGAGTDLIEPIILINSSDDFPPVVTMVLQLGICSSMDRISEDSSINRDSSLALLLRRQTFLAVS